ncbi:sensor domain-containing diguanylate cyclase [Solibacillus silvestris]|uniref:sensor domain-containing diguanylate cyclase n=1 Tax=Solibacillus silvestris TaxID=76853 RepID=UPI003F7F8B20
MFSLRNYIKLKYLFISVIALAFVLSSIISVYSSYKGNILLMQEQTLENNRVYALKLSETIDKFVADTKQIMQYSAKIIASDFDNAEKLQQEVDRLYSQEDTFSSVLIVDAEANILVNAPQTLGAAGKKAEIREDLRNREPYISDPFISPTGRELIILSVPIFTDDGIYKGLISGTIYLHQSNIFEVILGQHPYENGSYVYVVDTKGKLIYHPDRLRLGEDVSENEVVKRLLNNKQGSQAIVNSENKSMLAGYSGSKTTRWGIIVQTPYDEAIKMAGKQGLNIFFISLPFILLSTILIFILATRIVRPLQNMAEIAENSVKEYEVKKLKDIRAWYYEAYKIQEALIQSFSSLHGKLNTLKEESSTDSLTKLLNRRSFDKEMQMLAEQQQAYSLAILDVDWFKAINDTYGHTVGDEVLQLLAGKLKDCLHKDDLACRYGGEEFILVFSEASVQDAAFRVKALQQEFSELVSLVGKPLTFSAGIAHYPSHGNSLKTIIEQADEALYAAKENGRNRVEIQKLPSL